MPYVDITMKDGSICDSYVAYPKGDFSSGKKAPAVLFFMDAIGLRPAIEGMVERIAEQGYFVLAPNMFYRSGRAPIVPDFASYLSSPEKRPELFKHLFPCMAALTSEAIQSDTAKFLEYIDAQTQYVESGAPLGITGYCMGGFHATKACAFFPDRFKALGSWHAGRLADETNPNSPIFLVKDIKATAYFGHADNDMNMNDEHIATFTKALDAAGVKYHSIKYKDAPHGYTMVDTPMYQAAAAEAHWTALLDLYASTLKN